MARRFWSARDAVGVERVVAEMQVPATTDMALGSLAVVEEDAEFGREPLSRMFLQPLASHTAHPLATAIHTKPRWMSTAARGALRADPSDLVSSLQSPAD